jgi:hypothetical protein
MNSMAISLYDFVNNAPTMYGAKDQDGRPPTVVLTAAPGCAKTAVIIGPLVERLRKAFDCTVSAVRDVVSNRDAMDFRGFLIPVKTEHGPEAAFTKPDLVSRVESAPGFKDGIVILYLDEIWGADQLTQKVLADILDNGKLGDYQLPPNVWVIGSSNRQQDGAGANRTLSHTGNRIIQLEVFMAVEDWLRGYAVPQGFPPIITTFAEFAAGDFATEVPRGESRFMTFRSLSKVARYVMADNKARGVPDGMELNPSIVSKAIIAGCIGDAAETKLYAYADTAGELPSKHDVLTHPETARVPPVERLDAQYAARGLVLSLANQGEDLNQLWIYTTRLARSFQAATLKALSDSSRGGILLNAPAVTTWMQDPANHALLIGTYKS